MHAGGRKLSHKLGWKTASYAVMHLTVAITVAYALTLDWQKALAIGLIEPAVQTIAFMLHERAWEARTTRSGAGLHERSG